MAVLSVVTYHAFPNQVRGGFVGVDIFFVISGYLISSIILGSLAERRFSFREFYSRRVRRIFPALLLVLAACYLAGWFILLPDEYKQLGKHVAGGAGFISNFLLWDEAGYFDTAANLKPLLHLWSLGIEEQFYIAWPLLVYLAWKRRTKLAWLMPALVAASFLFNLQKTHTDVVAAFYSPISRFWELSLGSALAYFTLFHAGSLKRASLRIGSRLGRRAGLAEYAAAAGLLAIGVAIALLTTHSTFPGWWALLPTAGAVLLISAGSETWISRNVLSNPIMVFTGLISFPLYLWHWPLLAFERILGSGSPRVGMRLAAVALSFVLAALTYFFVEKPIRTGAPTLIKVLSLLVLMSGIGYAGYYSYAHGGLKSRLPGLISTRGRIEEAKSAKLIAEYVSLNYDAGEGARGGKCWLSPKQDPGEYLEECVEQQTPGARPKPLALVWGDSHAGRLFAGMRGALGSQFRLAQFTRDNCPPLVDFGYDMCNRSNLFVMDKIRKIRPDAVILFAVWNRYGSFSPGQLASERLNRTVVELKKAGVAKVIVVGPAPQWTIDLPRNLLNIYHNDLLHRVPERTTDGLDAAVQPVDAALAGLFSSRNDAVYISAVKEFCDKDGCLTRVNDEASGVTSWDYGHLTTAAAEFLVGRLPVNQ